MQVFKLLTVLALLTITTAALGQGGQLYTLTDIPPDVITQSIPQLEEDTRFRDTDITIAVNKDDLWKDDTADTPLWVRLVRGILRSRTMKKVNGDTYIRWERCGEVVPEDELYDRATEWSVSILASLKAVKRETGVSINPWGAFATTANEGGFNECTLDFQSRKWAAKNDVVEKFRLTYDKETIWDILQSDEWKKANRKKADLGPYQQRFAIKKVSRQQFDELLSVHPGVYLGVREMAQRAKDYMKRHKLDSFHKRPWKEWPGCGASELRKIQYDRKITSVARWLGARKDEI